MQHYFGTDGIRGRVNGDVINADFFQKLGWAVGCVLAGGENNTVLIGRDTRDSGEMLQTALIKGLTATGVQVKTLGILPTPAIAYLTKSLGMTAGAVISASHNDFQDNGIKFFNHNGMKLNDEIELKIEEKLAALKQIATSETPGSVTCLQDASDRYIEFCQNTLPQSFKLQGIKIVLDCAQGATYQVAPIIFSNLGADVVALYCQPDGLNINKNCGATNVMSLQQMVLENKADVGIAFDGDGDRLMMVDHLGNIVDGDEVLCILAQEHASQNKNAAGVVGTLMSNLGLEQALSQQGITFERAKVGDRFVLERLLEKGWTLGGEASGHIVDLNYTTTGDGIISALQVLRVMQRRKQSLNKLKQLMVKRPQILINVPVQRTVDLKEFPEIQQAATLAEQAMQGQGRVLLRVSGTEACIRVMVEGNDEQSVRQHAESLADFVKHSLGSKL